MRKGIRNWQGGLRWNWVENLIGIFSNGQWSFLSCRAEASGPNHLEIITEAIAATDGIEADVVVVASGLASIARHFPPQSAESVLVVDFADDFDDQAREATQQRREACTQRGWAVTTDQPVAEGGVQ